MTDGKLTAKKTLEDRIAIHLIDFPLNEPCGNDFQSDQLLNDVLNSLRLLYPGAYREFTPLVQIPANDQ